MFSFYGRIEELNIKKESVDMSRSFTSANFLRNFINEDVAQRNYKHLSAHYNDSDFLYCAPEMVSFNEVLAFSHMHSDVDFSLLSPQEIFAFSTLCNNLTEIFQPVEQDMHHKVHYNRIDAHRNGYSFGNICSVKNSSALYSHDVLFLSRLYAEVFKVCFAHGYNKNSLVYFMQAISDSESFFIVEENVNDSSEYLMQRFDNYANKVFDFLQFFLSAPVGNVDIYSDVSQISLAAAMHNISMYDNIHTNEISPLSQINFKNYLHFNAVQDFSQLVNHLQ